MVDTVLLTGISGFLGGHVALALLNAGYHVRGSVRDLQRSGKVRDTLKRAGADVSRLDFVALNLLDDTGWTEAAAGARYVQHTASPFVLSIPKDRNELIHPAVEGTRRAINAALAAGAERVVLTSSIAAIIYGHKGDPDRTFTEADWTQTGGDTNAYAESKLRAEQEAWALMDAAGRHNDLAVINPGVILGPLLDDDAGTSGQMVLRLLNGSVPAAPKLHLGFVDVRDVAAMHVAAMTSPAAGGHRHIASEGNFSFMDLANMLRSAFPDYARKIPRYELPNWLVRLYGLFDPDTRSNVESLGIIRNVDGRAGPALLGHPLISTRDAAVATANSLIANKLV